jgi:hypothetical protein
MARLKIAASLAGPLILLLLLGGLWASRRPSDPADVWKHCQYSYVRVDDDEFVRRLAARVQFRRDSMLSDDEWWRRAKVLPKVGMVDCGSFRATIHYAVDRPRMDMESPERSLERFASMERIKVTGDQEAYRKFREDTKTQRASPFYVDLRKWETSR